MNVSLFLKFIICIACISFSCITNFKSVMYISDIVVDDFNLNAYHILFVTLGFNFLNIYFHLIKLLYLLFPAIVLNVMISINCMTLLIKPPFYDLSINTIVCITVAIIPIIILNFLMVGISDEFDLL